MKRSTGIISPGRLEKAVLIHLGIMLFAASWIYGGNIWWMRSALTIWANLGACLTIVALLQPGESGRNTRKKAWWLMPWLLFVALVITSSFNPSFVPVVFEGESLLVHRGAAHPALPSTVNPSATLRELAFGAGVYLAAFNLLLVVRSRRSLRGLLVFAAASSVALAVFGTLQMLSGQGFYFGTATSTNIRFFASFIYYNHWGAFMILSLTTLVGLGFYQALNHRARDLWHSPFTIAMIGALIIAISAPVSASRAATGMAGAVVLIALTHALTLTARHRRDQNRPAWPPIVALLVLAVMTVGATGWLANKSISQRYTETRITIENDQSFVQGRKDLYRDTWTLAMQKPAFGWGLESYGTAFMLMRPRPLESNRQYETSYVEAHSDWLQSVAETGLVGTTLLLLMAATPLVSVPRRALAHPLVGYPLLGCAIIALYAWIEFPFASSAVFIAFWIVFFSAVRYARLQESPSPEEA
jgi:O-antigen ligase